MTRPWTWQLRTRALCSEDRVCLMGIVNVTPDSFSDGGLYATTQGAADHALRLLDAGADLLDIGGESTRPGSTAGTADALPAVQEQQRVLPVIAEVLRRRPGTLLSIDTYRASTAYAAVEAGAEIVNDVSGLLWDPEMAATVAALRCGVVLMHTRGLPSQWADQPRLRNEDVVHGVVRGLQQRLAAATAAGIAAERTALDPGFGFGKRGEENWALLDHLNELTVLPRPLLVGLSRKGFLAPDLPAAERDAATHRADALAVQQAAALLRVHDVAGAVAALKAVERTELPAPGFSASAASGS